MVEIVSPGKSGDAEIRHTTVSREASRFTALRPGGFVPAGKYAELLVDGALVMSDTRHEHITNIDAVLASQGHVLIGGLGLGMICHPIAAKKGVTKITVVERNKGVIDLVSPTLPKKVEVIHSDIFDYKPEKGAKFDTIYFDIWTDICTDALPDMGKLLRRFRKYLADDGWINCWCRDRLKSERRRELAEEREYRAHGIRI